MHHHCHCPPVHHCHTYAPPPPMFFHQPARFPASSGLFSSSSSSSSDSDGGGVCRVRVEVPPPPPQAVASDQTVPLLEPKPDAGACPSCTAVLFSLLFWGAVAWIAYSFFF